MFVCEIKKEDGKETRYKERNEVNVGTISLVNKFTSVNCLENKNDKKSPQSKVSEVFQKAKTFFFACLHFEDVEIVFRIVDHIFRYGVPCSCTHQ